MALRITEGGLLVTNGSQVNHLHARCGKCAAGGLKCISSLEERHAKYVHYANCSIVAQNTSSHHVSKRHLSSKLLDGFRNVRRGGGEGGNEREITKSF